MKFFTAVASLALASTVTAAPGWLEWTSSSDSDSGASSDPGSGSGSCKAECPQDACLQQSDAEDIVNKFISVLNHPDVEVANAAAQELLGDDFFEDSDSINMLAGHQVS